jgi:hypothetical protein
MKTLRQGRRWLSAVALLALLATSWLHQHHHAGHESAAATSAPCAACSTPSPLSAPAPAPIVVAPPRATTRPLRAAPAVLPSDVDRRTPVGRGPPAALLVDRT